MKGEKDPHGTTQTSKELNSINDSCDICQRLSKESGRFRISLPTEDILFHRAVYVYLMNIDGKRVLQIIDKDTLFSAASFFPAEERPKEIWDAFMNN